MRCWVWHQSLSGVHSVEPTSEPSSFLLWPFPSSLSLGCYMPSLPRAPETQALPCLPWEAECSVSLGKQHLQDKYTFPADFDHFPWHTFGVYVEILPSLGVRCSGPHPGTGWTRGPYLPPPFCNPLLQFPVCLTVFKLGSGAGPNCILIPALSHSGYMIFPALFVEKIFFLYPITLASL